MKKKLVILVVSSLLLTTLGIVSETNLDLRVTSNKFSSNGHNHTNIPDIIGLEENGTYLEESLSVISLGSSDVIRNLQVSINNGTIKLIHYLNDQNLWNLDSWDGEKWSRQYGVGSKRVTSWDNDGFKGKFFIHNHSFTNRNYTIGLFLRIWQYFFFIKLTYQYTSMAMKCLFCISGEQCLPSIMELSSSIFLEIK